MTRAFIFPNSIRFVERSNAGNTIALSLTIGSFLFPSGNLFVGRVGIWTIGSILFKSGNIMLNKVDVKEGGDDALFCREVKCKSYSNAF